MAFPRVLVVSGSAGNGHVMAAEAVAEALRTRHPEIDTAHLDALTKVSRWYARTYKWGYLRLVDRHPLLWRSLYEATDRGPSPVVHALTMFSGREFLAACRRWKPHAVVCTHFLAPEVLSRDVRRGRLETEFQVVVTDHDCHRLWVWPGITRFYVASDVVKARLVLQYGVDPARVFVTGIPVRSMFVARQDDAATLARLGLDAERPVVLFLTGGFATGDLARSILGVWQERRDAQIVALCGGNERLRRRIAALPRPAAGVLVPLGFVHRVSVVMSVADLVVTKSGGISTAELAALGKPIVVSGSIPGQEERNADVLTEAGAGVRALTPEEVRWRVGRLLDDPEALRSMARASKAFGRPNAAAEIADRVAGSVGVGGVARRPAFHGAF